MRVQLSRILFLAILFLLVAVPPVTYAYGQKDTAIEEDDKQNNDLTDFQFDAKKENVIEKGGEYPNEDHPDKKWYATSADMYALLINTNEAVTLKDPDITMKGSTKSNDQNSPDKHYTLLCMSGGTTTIKNGSVDAKAGDACGVFAGLYSDLGVLEGKKTKIELSGTKVSTKEEKSAGIVAGQGGEIDCSDDVVVKTSGDQSVAIQSDKDGAVTVTDGNYSTSGKEAPVIDATGAVTAQNAVLISDKARAVQINDTGSVQLTDCELISKGKGQEEDQATPAIILISKKGDGDSKENAVDVQKVDGNTEAEDGKKSGGDTEADDEKNADADTEEKEENTQDIASDSKVESGNEAIFKMEGGSISYNDGCLFRVSDTDADISLMKVAITDYEQTDPLLIVDGGGKALLQADNQTLKGTVSLKDSSSLELNLSGKTTFTGTISGASGKSGGKDEGASGGQAAVTIADGSLWVLTDDTTVSSITGDGEIDYNGHKLITGGKEYEKGSPDGTNISDVNKGQKVPSNLLFRLLYIALLVLCILIIAYLVYRLMIMRKKVKEIKRNTPAISRTEEIQEENRTEDWTEHRTERIPNPRQGMRRVSDIRVGKVHHIGKRQSQQDCMGSIKLDGGLFAVVADGMGGLENGDVISQKVVNSMISTCAHYPAERLSGGLTQVLAHANHEVNLMLGADVGQVSGSTVVAAIAQPNQFQWVSVGDSRVYLYRGGSLIQLNREHIYQVDLLRNAVNNDISFQDAYGNRQGKGLTSYIGMGTLRYVDSPLRPTPVLPGDILLLSSDGVFNTLTDQEIANILKENDNPDVAAAKMEETVLQKNNPYQDNFTMIMIYFT